MSLWAVTFQANPDKDYTKEAVLIVITALTVAVLQGIVKLWWDARQKRTERGGLLYLFAIEAVDIFEWFAQFRMKLWKNQTPTISASGLLGPNEVAKLVTLGVPINVLRAIHLLRTFYAEALYALEGSEGITQASAALSRRERTLYQLSAGGHLQRIVETVKTEYRSMRKAAESIVNQAKDCAGADNIAPLMFRILEIDQEYEKIEKPQPKPTDKQPQERESPKP